MAEDRAVPAKPACRIMELPDHEVRNFMIASFLVDAEQPTTAARQESVVIRFPMVLATFVNELYVYLAKPIFGKLDGPRILGNLQ